MKSALLALSLALLASARADAQATAPPQIGVPRAAITRDTIRVGDPFGVAVQLDLPSGAELLVQDTLDVSGEIENAGSRIVRVDTLTTGGLRYLVTFPLAAWRPGDHTLPPVTLTVRAAGAEQAIEVPLPELQVASVLPGDTANIQPKPLRDVWGADRLWWPILLGIAVLLALIALAWWWWRRRRRAEIVAPAIIMPTVLPREWAMRELERLRTAGLLERGELREFYIQLSQILRTYLDRLDAAWGDDLTTTELTRAVRAITAEAEPSLSILSRADLVKFARQTVSVDQARTDLTTAVQWVDDFSKPQPLLAEAA